MKGYRTLFCDGQENDSRVPSGILETEKQTARISDVYTEAMAGGAGPEAMAVHRVAAWQDVADAAVHNATEQSGAAGLATGCAGKTTVIAGVPAG